MWRRLLLLGLGTVGQLLQAGEAPTALDPEMAMATADIAHSPAAEAADDAASTAQADKAAAVATGEVEADITQQPLPATAADNAAADITAVANNGAATDADSDFAHDLTNLAAADQLPAAPRRPPFTSPAAIVVDTPATARAAASSAELALGMPAGATHQTKLKTKFAKKELADHIGHSSPTAVTTAAASKPENDSNDQDTAPVPDSLDEFVPDINTNQEGGNWVRKRIWWEQAESAFGTLVANNDLMLQTQKTYFEQRNSTDKLVEAAICKLTIERADLVALLNQLVELANRTGNVNEAELRLYNLAKTNHASLAALQKLFTDLADLDNALDQVLDQLLEQIDRCRDFEKNGWEDFKEIGQILNDQKAKALFYKVDGYQKNVAKVLEYITGPLQKYFMELTLRAKKLSEELLVEVAKLQAAGLDLKFELDVKLGKAQAPVIETAKEREAKMVKKVVKPTGWWSDVTGFFSELWSWLTTLFK